MESNANKLRVGNRIKKLQKSLKPIRHDITAIAQAYSYNFQKIGIEWLLLVN